MGDGSFIGSGDLLVIRLVLVLAFKRRSGELQSCTLLRRFS